SAEVVLAVHLRIAVQVVGFISSQGSEFRIVISVGFFPCVSSQYANHACRRQGFGGDVLSGCCRGMCDHILAQNGGGRRGSSVKGVIIVIVDSQQFSERNRESHSRIADRKAVLCKSAGDPAFVIISGTVNL